MRPSVRRQLIPALLVAGLLPGMGAGEEVDHFTPTAGEGFTPLGRAGRIEKRGDGPVPMILIPRGDLAPRVFESFVRRNGSRYSMYLVTPAGVGGTDPYPMPSSADLRHTVWLDSLRDAVLQLIRDEGLENPIVMGHADGGDAALKLALDHPEEIAGVVAVATAPMARFPSGEAPERREERLRMLHEEWIPFFREVDAGTWNSPWSTSDRPLAVDPACSDALRGMVLARSVPVSVRYFAEHLSTDRREALPGLRVPALVVLPQQEPVPALARRAQMRASEFGGDVAAARAAVTRELAERHGSEAAGLAEAYRNDPWEALRGRVADLRIEYVPDNAWTLVWEDNPERFDALVGDFAARVASRSR